MGDRDRSSGRQSKAARDGGGPDKGRVPKIRKHVVAAGASDGAVAHNGRQTEKPLPLLCAEPSVTCLVGLRRSLVSRCRLLSGGTRRRPGPDRPGAKVAKLPANAEAYLVAPYNDDTIWQVI